MKCAHAFEIPRSRLSIPFCLCDTAAMIGDSGENEQEIREAVNVAQQHRIDRRIEGDDAALGAAADGARDVQRGAGRGAAGENEAPQRRQLGLELIDQPLEPRDVLVVDHRFADARRQFVGRIGELGAEREQIALQSRRASDRARDRRDEARTRPSQALSSSISPYASTRGSSLRARSPLKSDVSPVSPVRV